MTRTKEEIEEIVENLGYIYVDDYWDDKGKRNVFIQDRYGYKYNIDVYRLISGQGISFVDKSNPFSLENISLWLNLNNSQFDLLKDNIYLNAHEKLNLYCKICKDYPIMNWNNIYSGYTCGICDGKRVGLYHNLAVQRPDIAAEWHPTKNFNLTPKDVTYASGKKVWWLCPNGHEYYSRVADRTNKESGCKTCSNIRQESKIATELKKYILNKYHAKEEYSIFRNPETKYPLPFDIYIFGGKEPKINGVYIEIHSMQHYKLDSWHKQLAEKNRTTTEEEFEYQKHKDRLKCRFARKHGTYIEVDLRKIKTIEKAIEYVENRI